MRLKPRLFQGYHLKTGKKKEGREDQFLIGERRKGDKGSDVHVITNLG